MYHDKTLLCLGCARAFSLSADDQQLHGELGHDEPTRCPACQQLREDRLRMPEAVAQVTSSDAARRQIAALVAAAAPIDVHYSGRPQSERPAEREASFSNGRMTRGSAARSGSRRPSVAGSGHRG